MGKYAMTRSAARNNRQVRSRSRTSAMNDDGMNRFKYLFGDFSILGVKPIQLYDQYNYMDDYLSNRNMSWSDMLYPSIAKNHAVGNWHTSTRALERLYE